MTAEYSYTDIDKLLKKRVHLHYKLESSKCIRHSQNNDFCEYNIEQQDFNIIIHGINCNYIMRAHHIYCTKTSHQKGDIFTWCEKNIIRGHSDYIKITNDEWTQNVYQIKQIYIAHELIIFANNATIIDNYKIVSKWYNILKLNFRTALQTALNSNINSYVEQIDYCLKMNVIDIKYLQTLFYWLWVNIWHPAVSMCNIYIIFL